MEDKQLTQEEREKLHEQQLQNRINSDKRKKITKKVLIYSIIIIVLAAIIYIPISNSSKPSIYDDFAKCLSENNVKFYGSFQCPHCADQKALFGKSMKYVNYIECGPLGGPVDQGCIDAGVKAYPTWIFENETREGVLSLGELAQQTGCTLPQ